MTKVTSIFTKKNPASTFGRLGVGSVFGRVNQASTFTEGGVDYVAQTVPLLLDTYTGATAAYSLRKLRTAYAGNCIRVRRSSDDAEADIGFTAGNVLDETALLAHCGVGDGFIVKWYDQANSHNASQTTALRQWQIVSSGSVLITNNKAAITKRTGVYGMNITTISGISQPVTSFVVTESNGNIIRPHGGQNQISIIIDQNSVRLYSGAWYNKTFNQGYRQQLVFALFNGSSSKAGVNGSALQTGDSGTNGFYDNKFGIGAYMSSNEFPVQSMQEIILYPANKETDRSGIESNINSFYSIY